jgi:uncharacterized repeat protein (TIGR03803 family)
MAKTGRVAAWRRFSYRLDRAFSVDWLESRYLLSGITALASFDGGSGNDNFGQLVIDSSGDLFGITHGGTTNPKGTIFEIPGGGGSPVLLATFNGINGNHPNNLLIDSNGNLFGTTGIGGAHTFGGIFELPSGTSTILNLYSFTNAGDGANPVRGLILDSNGNLFGATSRGGAHGFGTIFELPSGSTTVTPLASFAAGQLVNLAGDLVADGSGNIFGTTVAGGTAGDGTIFEYASGGGTISTVASFNGPNGIYPVGDLVIDPNGNIFGSAIGGGANGAGAVFELASGASTITLKASLAGTHSQSGGGGLVMDADGNLIGDAYDGGANNGILFEVASGSSVVTPLAAFNGTNGSGPNTGPVVDGNGNVFGTTAVGGANNVGTVFEFQSVPFANLFNGLLTINGTAGNDTISVSNDGNGNYVVNENNLAAETFPIATVQKINANGRGGNDLIIVKRGVAASATLFGGPGNDTLSGRNGGDFIDAGGGNSLLQGVGGNDTLYGGRGNDTLSAAGGPNNLLEAGPGNALMFANNGFPDTLFGGPGQDTAHVDAGGLDSIPNNDIADVIVGP